MSFQQQIAASLDDTYCYSLTNYATTADAIFGKPMIAKAYISVGAFVRFLLDIPDGSTITSAIITLVASVTRTDDFTAQINFTNEDDAADFTNNPWSLADGGTDVAWTVPDFVKDAQVNTPDITSLIQAFINRAGYNANNHIAIRIKHGDAASGEVQRFYQYDGSSLKCAVLTIEYTPPEEEGKILYVSHATIGQIKQIGY